MSSDNPERSITVRGTAIVPEDPPRIRLQKLARITLDSMVQFVGLLDAAGTVLEINKVALDAGGIKLADVEGKPFWTTIWWQVSEEANQGIRDMIARAAKGEFVRWDTPIFASADGSVTIIIDASLMPVMDDDGTVVFICALRCRHRPARAAAGVRPVRSGMRGPRSVAGRARPRLDDRAQPGRTPWRVRLGAERRQRPRQRIHRSIARHRRLAHSGLFG